jgi:hypothetical protein
MPKWYGLQGLMMMNTLVRGGLDYEIIPTAGCSNLATQSAFTASTARASTPADTSP